MSNQTNHRGRILIVEDQGVVATDIERCLEDSGFEVTGIATSMKDAIREVSTSRPDLILMDIRIKGEADGIEAADHLHRSFDLPIVYLTAHDDPDTMERAKRTEPMAFLLKPFKPAELTSTVEIALNRNRAEQQMRERERSFLSAMDAVGDGVLTADSQGRVRFMNRAAQALTGWTQELALGRQAADVVHIVSPPDAGSESFRALLDIGSSAKSNYEYRILSRNGRHHWLALKATSILAADNSSIRVVVMQDVTGRKQSEQVLRRQADLLDQSQEPILTWDLDGAIQYWNRGAQTLYGYSSWEVLGLAVGQLLPAAHPLMDDPWEAALERDGRWSGELTRKTRDGREIVVEAVLVVVQDGEGQRTVLETDRDITDRKTTELEIRRLNQELRTRVGELEAMNRELASFDYSISHDLRAPLRHINGFANILLEKTDLCPPGDARDFLEHIHQAGQKMGHMVDALLELSRTSRKEPARRPTALKALVEDVVGMLKTEVRDRNIEWRIGDLPLIDCDPTLTRQVLVNLIANAVKFTCRRSPAVIEVGHTRSDGQTVVFVRDNGVGFHMKHADKLFGVFQRLHCDDQFEGTGIGLATVRRIIDKHGGGIWAEGELEKGATFYFTLEPPAPRSSPLSARASQEKADAC